MNKLKPSRTEKAITKLFSALLLYRRHLVLFLLLAASVASAQAGFATSQITSPIKNLVTIANATIAGLAILAVIYYAVRWIGGDEGAAKKIIGVIVVAVIALGAANFLGWVTGKSEFDTFTN